MPEYTAPAAVYRTARSMESNRIENLSYNLTWRLPVDSGFRYIVRLHFCEFDLSVEAIKAAFDVIEAVGGKGIPIYND
ncbi:hypothetical protein CRYUN_Cryun22dG0037600 [Craigia yunnanensis]